MKAVNYCMNRNLIENGAYQINAESCHNIESFLYKIFQVFRLNATDIADIDDLLDTLQNQEIAIVIHHCKNLIEKQPEEFEDLINKINKKTFKIKIILVIDMIDPKIFMEIH